MDIERPQPSTHFNGKQKKIHRRRKGKKIGVDDDGKKILPKNRKHIKTHKIINKYIKLQFNGAEAVVIVQLPFHNITSSAGGIKRQRD